MVGRHSSEKYIRILEGITIKTLVHGRSTLMTEFNLSKGSRLPEHSHPFEQTGYLVSGSIVLYIKGSPYRMQKGDSWCIPSDAVHNADIIEDSVAIEVFSPPREDYLKYVNESDIIIDEIQDS